MNEDLSLEIGRQLREQFFLLDRRLLVQKVLEMLPDSAGQGGNGVRRVCPSMRVRALAHVCVPSRMCVCMRVRMSE